MDVVICNRLAYDRLFEMHKWIQGFSYARIFGMPKVRQ